LAHTVATLGVGLVHLRRILHFFDFPVRQVSGIAKVGQLVGSFSVIQLGVGSVHPRPGVPCVFSAFVPGLILQFGVEVGQVSAPAIGRIGRYSIQRTGPIREVVTGQIEKSISGFGVGQKYVLFPVEKTAPPVPCIFLDIHVGYSIRDEHVLCRVAASHQARCQQQ